MGILISPSQVPPPDPLLVGVVLLTMTCSFVVEHVDHLWNSQSQNGLNSEYVDYDAQDKNKNYIMISFWNNLIKMRKHNRIVNRVLEGERK